MQRGLRGLIMVLAIGFLVGCSFTSRNLDPTYQNMVLGEISAVHPIIEPTDIIFAIESRSDEEAAYTAVHIVSLGENKLYTMLHGNGRYESSHRTINAEDIASLNRCKTHVMGDIISPEEAFLQLDVDHSLGYVARYQPYLGKGCAQRWMIHTGVNMYLVDATNGDVVLEGMQAPFLPQVAPPRP